MKKRTKFPTCERSERSVFLLSKKIKVMLVDDEALVLFSVRTILHREPDMHVLCETADGNEVLQLLQHNQPDVVLLDIQMPHMNGLECMHHIRALHPNLPIVLLTTFDDEQYIIEGLANGARSYLLKTPQFENLAQHIRDALADTFTMSGRVAVKLANFLNTKKGATIKTVAPSFFETYPLTRTEQQIVLLLSQRLTNSEMAEQLHVQIGTIKNHLVRIFDKLQVKSRQEALALLERYSHDST